MMHAKTPALALAILASGSAFADELNARVDKVDRQAGTLEIGGQTIHATQGQLNGIVEGSRYTVRWEQANGRSVATQIVQRSD